MSGWASLPALQPSNGLCSIDTAVADVTKLSSFTMLVSLVRIGFTMIQVCCQWIIDRPSRRLLPIQLTPPNYSFCRIGSVNWALEIRQVMVNKQQQQQLSNVW